MSAGPAEAPFVEVKYRGLITVSIMAAMVMQILDMETFAREGVCLV